MNDARLLRIANRISLLLLKQLGESIDVKRMISEPLYARDVLLVCEAEPGSDLDSLAQHFRVASAEPVDEHGQPSGFGAESTGFGSSRPAGTESELPSLPMAHTGSTPPRWFSRGRWLSR
jgi:hypothetical protein